jgi:hypothetical protein
MIQPANAIEGLESIETYKAELLRILEQGLPKYSNSFLERLYKDSIEDIDNESIEILVPKIIPYLIDSSPESLSNLSKKIMNHLSSINSKFLVNSEDLAKLIHLVASRKNYGTKNKDQYEDCDLAALWCWELFEHKQPPFILKERALIGGLVRSLDKLVKEMAKPNSKTLAECFSMYNKNIFSYNKFKQDELEKKRKKNLDNELKQKKMLEIQEKKKLIEEQKTQEKKIFEEKRLEEKKKRVEEINKKKEEDRKKAEYRKIEEERKKKEEEEKRKKEENCIKPIHIYFTKKNVPSNVILTETINYSKPLGSTDAVYDWNEIFSTKVAVIERKKSFIYFTDSVLKPYYSVELKPKQAKGALDQYPNIDYEKDSEEEYEELNGEDINSFNDEEEEEDEESDSEKEEINKFIVNDGYLSPDEKPEDEEIGLYPININNEILPMQIFEYGSDKLTELKAFSIIDEIFPIQITSNIVKPLKEIQKPKSVIDDEIIKEIIQIGIGKFSKKDIIKAILDKYPTISKKSVENVIKSNLQKKKEGKIKVYLSNGSSAIKIESKHSYFN